MGDPLKQKVIDWIHEIFIKRHVKILEFDFPDYDTSGGYAAEIIFVNLRGIQNGKEQTYSLLVKKGKPISNALVTLGLKKGYASEVELYSKTIPILRELAKNKSCSPFENIPYCYGTVRTDDEFVVILENLKPKGFQVKDIKHPMDLDHIKLVFEAYAQWHAFNLALSDQEEESFGKLGRNLIDFVETKIFPLFVNTLKGEVEFVMEFYNEKEKPHIVEKLKKLRDRVEEDCRKSFANEEKPYVIRHGDCWNNNFLFHYDEKDGKPDDVVIIDWQLGILGSPLVDVAQFLFYNSSKRELEHMDDLLILYYDTLSRQIRDLGSDPEKILPWQACKSAFDKCVPLAIAGMTMAVRMSYKLDQNGSYDITESLESGDFRGVFGEGLRDPEGYFERVNGILEFCAQRGYI